MRGGFLLPILPPGAAFLFVPRFLGLSSSVRLSSSPELSTSAAPLLRFGQPNPLFHVRFQTFERAEVRSWENAASHSMYSILKGKEPPPWSTIEL